jgi:hypothetical protein
VNIERPNIRDVPLSDREAACLDELATKYQLSAAGVIQHLIQREHMLEFPDGPAAALQSVLSFTPMTFDEIHAAVVHRHPKYAGLPAATFRAALRDFIASRRVRVEGKAPRLYALVERAHENGNGEALSSTP